MDSICSAFILGILLTVVSTQSTCGGGSKCVVINDCPGIYNMFKTHPTPYLTEVFKNLRCDYINNKHYVCCPSLYKDPSAVYQPQTSLPNTTVCGIQSNDRIVGGTVTDLDEHPWLALLRYDKPKGWGFYCAGVLISSRYVLTAAHCLKGNDLPSTWRLTQVRLGEWNISSPRDCFQEDCSPTAKDISVAELIPHEKYDPSNVHQQNDIALLRLSQDVDFTDFIKPICLPTTPEQRMNLFTGYDMEVAGWGKTENTTMSQIKLKVRVPVVDRATCDRVYMKAGRTISDKQLCAGGEEGKDSCRGDSGGPLMGQLQTAQNWFVFGVVSYGPSPCGTSNWPGVYTRVGSYVDWILANMK
ncbi:CLIP domain-containing serine protease HP8-like [Battus philenor]|uniref:CLIP domain-containing serine protease HP8-like n=1 Tax=Battus philenor TaxID=42288 RepID=UPI0035CF244F